MALPKGDNRNRHARGSIATSDPLRDLNDIAKIKTLLAYKPRDLALFTLGINTNLRGCDLVRIKYADIRGLQVGGELCIRELKTGKIRLVPLNQACIDAIENLLKHVHYEPDDYLFKSQKTGEHLHPITLGALVKKWTSTIGLEGKGRWGAHTLRKTWGFHMRTKYKKDIGVLMACFNHSSPQVTQRYLGITPQEIKDVYKNVL